MNHGFISAATPVLMYLVKVYFPDASFRLIRCAMRFNAIASASALFGLFLFWSYSSSILEYAKTDYKGQTLSKKPSNDDYNDLTCKFARLDPFDPSIQPYVSHPRSIKCKRVQDYDLTFDSDDGYLRINASEWKRARKEYKNLACTARAFDRPLSYAENDKEIIYGNAEQLEPDFPLPMPGDTVVVMCNNGSGSERIYSNIHTHPTFCGKRPFKDLDTAPEDQLSILMMVIDSVSLSALKRQMPSTYKYLLEKMEFHIFNGYNKVGDNTRPNMFPVLTGKRIRTEQPDMEKEVDDLRRFLDKGPELIWKRFANKGYSIVMNEDYSWYPLFHFGSKGYHRKPADFYYRSLWLAIDAMGGKLHSSSNCLGNHPKIKFQINLIRKHLEIFKNKLQFLYSFSAELSHNDGSSIEKSDEMFTSFFRFVNEEKPELINRSVIIFMADHGHRFSSIRKTLIGLLEERQPMFSIRFPDWFYEKYPEIKKNLRSNTMRLTTPFDAYETLKDIFEMNYSGKQRDLSDRGLSMLYPIPKNRTCAAAGIAEHFCTCVENQIFNKSNKLSIAAADFLAGYLNNLTNNATAWNKTGQGCLNWRRSDISRVERIGVSGKVKAGGRHLETWESKQSQPKKIDPQNHLATGEKLRIVVELKPMSAVFEAEMIYGGDFDQWTVLGEVMRLNAYGNQAWCVDDEVVRKYCVCKEKQF